MEPVSIIVFMSSWNLLLIPGSVVLIKELRKKLRQLILQPMQIVVDLM